MVNPYCPPGCPISDREGEDDSPRELRVEIAAADVEMVLARLLAEPYRPAREDLDYEYDRDMGISDEYEY